jgi:hypothetical protein
MNCLIKNALSRKTPALCVGASLSLFALLCGCGGGGSSEITPVNQPPSSGSRSVDIAVTLETELADSNNRRAPFVGYRICAFSTCGTSNQAGETSFAVTVPQGAVGIEFTVSGPEFSGIIGFSLPRTAQDVDAILLRRANSSTLLVGQVKFNGVVDTSITPAGFNDGD